MIDNDLILGGLKAFDKSIRKECYASIREKILSNFYEVDSMEGEYLLDGKWYRPLYGCDTLDWIMDSIQ